MLCALVIVTILVSVSKSSRANPTARAAVTPYRLASRQIIVDSELKRLGPGSVPYSCDACSELYLRVIIRWPYPSGLDDIDASCKLYDDSSDLVAALDAPASFRQNEAGYLKQQALCK